MFMDNFKE